MKLSETELRREVVKLLAVAIIGVAVIVLWPAALITVERIAIVGLFLATIGYGERTKTGG
jgi:hypothetical protein